VDPGQGRSKTAELHDVCTTALILFRQLSILLSPVLPGVAANVAKFLNDANSTGRRPMWPAAWCERHAGPHHRRLLAPDDPR
jgi:methionyl-tRNA synthetase